VYTISQGHRIFAHIQEGGWVVVGVGEKAAKQGKSPFTAKMCGCLLADCQPHKTSEHFFLEVKDVAVCM
jgi:hypothetical protein